MNHNHNGHPIDLAGLTTHVKRLDQYFGLWAIEPQRGAALFDRARQTNLIEHAQAHQHDKPHATYQADQITLPAAAAAEAPARNLAVIYVAGTLTKAGSSLDASSSLIAIRRDLQQAAADPTIDGILLYVDSPGGTAAGTADVAAAVAAAAAVKPVLAFAEDLAASAAYWIASQADEIMANNATAQIGSIGTYAVIYDSAAAFAAAGLRANLFTTGPFKGAGTPGTDLTPEQAAHFQARVHELNAVFMQAVAAGRGLTPAAVADLADGRTWLAADAQANGLIDGIGSFDAALARLAAMIDERNTAAAAAATSTTNNHDSEPHNMPRTAATASRNQADARPDNDENKPADETKPAENPTATPPAEDTPPQSAAAAGPQPQRFNGHTAAEWLETFGEPGARWALEGKTWEQALNLRIEQLEHDLAAAQDTITKQAAVINGLRGDDRPASFQPADGHQANANPHAYGPARLAPFIKIASPSPSKN